jgi:hypothetical protein
MTFTSTTSSIELVWNALSALNATFATSAGETTAFQITADGALGNFNIVYPTLPVALTSAAPINFSLSAVGMKRVRFVPPIRTLTLTMIVSAGSASGLEYKTASFTVTAIGSDLEKRRVKRYLGLR